MEGRLLNRIKRREETALSVTKMDHGINMITKLATGFEGLACTVMMKEHAYITNFPAHAVERNASFKLN